MNTQTIDGLVNAYSQSLVARRMTEATVRGYTADIRGFLEWRCKFGRETLDTAQDLNFAGRYREYLVEKQKPSTANRKLVAIRSFLAWRSGSSREPRSAQLKAEPIKTKTEQLVLTSNDVERLLSVARQRGNANEIAIVLLALRCGLRIGELCSLSWEAVDLSSRPAVLKTSGNAARRIPLDDELRLVLERYKRSMGNDARGEVLKVSRGSKCERISRGTVQYVLNQLSKACRFEVSHRILRRTFCGSLAERLPSPSAFAEVAGFRNERSVMQYLWERQVVKSHPNVDLKLELLRNSENRCERCGVESKSDRFFDLHYIRDIKDRLPVMGDGPDPSGNLLNAILLCPNCHRITEISEDRETIKKELIAIARRRLNNKRKNRIG